MQTPVGWVPTLPPDDKAIRFNARPIPPVSESGTCLRCVDLGQKLVTEFGLIVRPLDKERTSTAQKVSRFDQQGRVGIKLIPRQGQIGDVPLQSRPYERGFFSKPESSQAA